MPLAHRHRVTLPRWGSIALLLLLTLLGCGQRGGLEKIEVSGNVTLDDRPITNGEILFYPIESTAGSVSGGPIKDGHYLAKGRGGVPVGKHRVEIRGFQSPTPASGGELAIEGGPAEQYVPPQYNTRSTLTAVVDAAHTTLDFSLSSHQGVKPK
jgi:hypothetical protein